METEYIIDSLITHLELIKSDLRWQLSFEEIDWDYFIESVQKAKLLRGHIENLKLDKEKVYGK